MGCIQFLKHVKKDKWCRNEDARVEILVKICKALDCKIDYIVEY